MAGHSVKGGIDMTCYVDLNSDVGESFGAYKLGNDEEVLKYVSSANIACGWHAGDPMVMANTVAIACRRGTAIGAHTGFPDLLGFGRRNMTISPEEAKQYTVYQMGALQAFARAAGSKVQHVKPHGALYNMAAKDPKLAAAIADGVWEVDRDVVMLGLAGSEMIKAARVRGLKAASEVFADRAYNPDGTLVSRNIPGSMIHDINIAIPRVVRMITEGRVTAINGEDINIKADSICVHGDNPEAVGFIKLIREALKKSGIDIKPLHYFIK